MGFFNSLGQVFSNRKNFKEYEQRQADIDAQRKALAQKKPASKEELDKAKKEGKVLIDITDIMDSHSEDVAESTETATMLPQSIAPFATTIASGLGVYKFLYSPSAEKYEKFYKDFLNKNYAEYSSWANTIQEKNIKNLYFFEHSFLNKKNLEKLKNVKDENVQAIYKKALKKFEEFSSNSTVKNFNKFRIGTIVAPIAIGIATFIGTTIWATKTQVNSSRIARWQSRKQLEDPKYFVQYTPEQIEQAKKNLEAKEEKEKGFSKKLFNKKNKASLIQVIKDNKAYKAWKKQDTDESKKVQRELSQEELIEAKKDQEVIQRVTRIINNKAEDYSENMEVAADTIIAGTPFLGAAVGGLFGFFMNKTGILDRKADKTVQKFIDGLESNEKTEVKNAYEALKNHKKGASGGIKKSLRFIEEVMSSNCKNVAHNGFSLEKIKTLALGTKGIRTKLIAIAGTVLTSVAGAIIGLKLQKSSSRAGRYLAKRELEQNPQNFIGYTEEELKEVQNVKGEKPSLGARFKEYITFIPRVIGDYIDYKKYVNTTGAKNRALKEELVKLEVTDEQLQEAKNMQRKIFNTFEKVDDKSQEYSESIEAATEIAKPAIALGGILTALSPVIIIGTKVARGKLNLTKPVEKFTKFLGEHTTFLKGKKVNKYLNNVEQNLKNAIHSTENAEFLSEKTKELMPLVEAFIENINTKSVKKFISGDLKAIINNFDDKTIEEFIQNRSWLNKAFGDCKKEDVIKLYNNLEKIINNIPEEKLQQILNTLKKEFEKNPEKTLAVLSKSKELKSVFITSGMKKALAAAGGTWTGLNFLLTFAIESYLAKMQKEAGRLGVMKAMEELKDPLYYADIEPKSTENNKTQSDNTTDKYLR